MKTMFAAIVLLSSSTCVLGQDSDVKRQIGMASAKGSVAKLGRAS